MLDIFSVYRLCSKQKINICVNKTFFFFLISMFLTSRGGRVLGSFGNILMLVCFFFSQCSIPKDSEC